MYMLAKTACKGYIAVEVFFFSLSALMMKLFIGIFYSYFLFLYNLCCQVFFPSSMTFVARSFCPASASVFCCYSQLALPIQIKFIYLFSCLLCVLLSAVFILVWLQTCPSRIVILDNTSSHHSSGGAITSVWNQFTYLPSNRSSNFKSIESIYIPTKWRSNYKRMKLIYIPTKQ